MDTKIIYNLGIIVLIIAAAFVIYKYFLPPISPGISPTPTNTPTPSATAVPKDKSSCEKAGGYWKDWLGGEGFCTLPTTDADKSCSDGSECQGKVCIAQLTKEQQEAAKKSPDGLIAAKGKCAVWMTTLGCHTRVVEGKAGLGTTLCAD